MEKLSNKLDTENVEKLVKGIKDSPISRIRGEIVKKKITKEKSENRGPKYQRLGFKKQPITIEKGGKVK